MAEPAPLSPVDLRRILTQLFNAEELRTLSFDLGVDYDNLRGEGKAARARELVALAMRRGFLPQLEAAVRCERPNLDVAYSPERVQQLQASILAGADRRVRDDFHEFTQQIDAYVNEFNSLHTQLAEWKDIHNLLQDMQSVFAPCRSYIFVLGRLGPLADQRERALYEVEVEWRPCRRSLRKLQQFTLGIEGVGESRNTATRGAPSWLDALSAVAAGIDGALLEDDAAVLAEQLSIFGDQVDQFLYQADKALRDVVSKIQSLPRPGSQAVR
jgi:hypothetical protein